MDNNNSLAGQPDELDYDDSEPVPQVDSPKRQLEVPGTERESIPSVFAAAKAYDAAKYERIEVQEREKRAQEALLLEMREHGLTEYVDWDGEVKLHVKIDEKTKLTCKREKTDEAN